jgi:hypothetical protein
MRARKPKLHGERCAEPPPLPSFEVRLAGIEGLQALAASSIVLIYV